MYLEPLSIGHYVAPIFSTNQLGILLPYTHRETHKDTYIKLIPFLPLPGKYADHFDRSPGNVLTETAEDVLDLDTVEKCARACLTQTKFKCLSFDHCPVDEKAGCSLHTVHYPNANTREAKTRNSTNCGHYFSKILLNFLTVIWLNITRQRCRV